MSAAYSNAEIGDDGDFVVTAGTPPMTAAIYALAALALAGLLVWALRKGGS